MGRFSSVLHVILVASPEAKHEDSECRCNVLLLLVIVGIQELLLMK